VVFGEIHYLDLTREIAPTNRASASPSGTKSRMVPVVPEKFVVSRTSCIAGSATAPMTIVATIIPIAESTRDCPVLVLVTWFLKTDFAYSNIKYFTSYNP